MKADTSVDVRTKQLLIFYGDRNYPKFCLITITVAEKNTVTDAQPDAPAPANTVALPDASALPSAAAPPDAPPGAGCATLQHASPSAGLAAAAQTSVQSSNC